MCIRSPEETLEKYPHQLSGGMLQRIMIGIAVSMTPKLLIADEPTTAIDAITQFEILNEFLRVKKEHQMAMIFISHDLNAISRVADRIVVLNQGQVADQAPLPSLAPMLEKVLPAVVSVRVEGTASQGQKIPEEFKKFFGDDLPDQPAQPFEGLGSGVIINANKGYVLTNNHVINQAQKISIQLNDGREFDAKLIGRR